MKIKEKNTDRLILFRRKSNKFFRVMAGVLAGLAIFLGITQLLNRMYVNDDPWYRILWHHYYEDEGKIDNLFIGSSHLFCNINPAILDKRTGEYNFNLASPSQPLNASYYLLREAAKENKISHVYLEMYYGCTVKDDHLSRHEINWSNTDYMRLSGNKISYMLSIGGVKKLPEVMLPFSRYRSHLDDWDYVKDNLEEKGGEDYRNYEFEQEWTDGNGREIICGQGYHDSTRVFEDKNRCFAAGEDLREDTMGKENERYCRRIIEYCRKKEIPITLFVSPMNELRVLSTFDYDNYVNAVRELADEYDIAYYDFNLAKDEYLPLQDGRYYQDSGHLNRYGAELYTNFFYEAVLANDADSSNYFYSSYKEKLESLPPTIYGVFYRGSEEGTRIMRVASNRDLGMEYKITMTPKEGESYIVQDFEENIEFSVSSEEHGICTIVARTKEIPNEVQTMEINY